MRAVVAAVLATLLASALAPAGLAARTLVFTLKTQQGATEIHRHPPAGNIGDTYVSTLTLVNRSAPQLGKGARATVGTMEFTFTIIASSRADFDSVSMLPGGTVIANGSSIPTSSAMITIPVVGGTGRYRRATGTVTISPSSTMLNTYRLDVR